MPRYRPADLGMLWYMRLLNLPGGGMTNGDNADFPQGSYWIPTEGAGQVLAAVTRVRVSSKVLYGSLVKPLEAWKVLFDDMSESPSRTWVRLLVAFSLGECYYRSFAGPGTPVAGPMIEPYRTVVARQQS